MMASWDSFAANQVLSDKISAETESGGTTQNRALLAATALTLFGEELLNMDGEEAEEFFLWCEFRRRGL